MDICILSKIIFLLDLKKKRKNKKNKETGKELFAPKIKFVEWQLELLNTANGKIIRNKQLLSDAELYDLSEGQLRNVVNHGVTALEEKLINFKQIQQLFPHYL